ncbi:MAG: hypothetical protein V9E93_19575 [Steroidobacteraceae bacterium]|nr:hypothetical protein [Pseudomonadota bacterium]MBP6106731.1 hypothetical protein [Steroidobacteraceae bacterium]MBP7013166.1 hypothetical protein [Steroidobacteraceae bacterium]
MTLGYKGELFYVNSATGRPPERLPGVDPAGSVPLAQVVSEARAQGVDVTPENVAGTLFPGRVTIRRGIQQIGNYTKQRANQIMSERNVTGSAPLRIARQPAYTLDQLSALVTAHEAQARQNKRRTPRKA